MEVHMYDLPTLYHILKERMPFIRRRLSAEEWQEFSAALRELAPAFATDDPQALEEATDRGYELCFRYAAVRGQFPMPGAIIGAPPPPTSEVEDIPARMHELCSNPEAAAEEPAMPKAPEASEEEK